MKNLKQKLLLLLILSNIPIRESLAINKFYENSERGWYYFEDLAEKEKKTAKIEEKSKNKITTPLNKMNADQVLDTLEKVQKEIKVRQARYVLEPTVENAKEFLSYQQHMFDNGEKASKAMQTALLKYPYLDPRIENPVAEQAIKLKNIQLQKLEEQKISEFAHHFKLYYFFKESCSYCKAFSPVINNLVKAHDFKIEAITMDGSKMADIPSSRNDELVKNLKVEHTPTLIAYNQQHNLYVPIANGFMPEQDLKTNIVHVYDHLLSLTMEVEN